jgi:ribose-phosphate pyrophosphokinase
MKPVLIETNHHIGKSVAKKSGIDYSKAIFGPFPDNETYFRVTKNVKGRDVFLLVDFAKQANDVLILCLLATKTLKQMKAKKIYLLAPYMPYLRQDHAFHKGESISGFTVSKFLSEIFDGVITLDPHLHRVTTMKGFFSCKAQKLTATKLIAEYLKKKDCVLVGPDAESKQWINAIAKAAGKDFVVAKKKRYGSRKVEVKIDKGKVEIKGKKVIIVDDIISTGHTIMEAVKALKKEKIKNIECYCIHGLFMECALEKIKKMNIIVGATNSVKNKVEKIDISKELVKSIKKWV